MRIGCNAVAFRKQPLEYALERIACAGYKWVELEANLSWCDHVRIDRDDPLTVRRTVLEAGILGITCIGTHRGLLTESTAEEDIRHALEFAQAAGVPVIATGEGRLPHGMSVEKDGEILRPTLERLVEVAEKCGVYLAMEPHGSISLQPGGLSKILELAPSAWLAVNFDTANPHRGDYVGTTHRGFEWKLDETARGDELAVLQPIADRVVHVHWKDVVGRSAVVIGQGDVKLRALLAVVQKAGHDGVLSYETEGWEDAEQAQRMIQASLDATKRMLDEEGILYE